MEKVHITICVAKDGFYAAYCNDDPSLFGGGDTPEDARKELEETLRLTKETGKEQAFIYPDWLDDEYEFVIHWDVQSLLEYYSGIITPTALGRLSGIHPKQLWAYQHGISRPRKKQIDKIGSALHKLGKELTNAMML